jgi:hypothetical protein
MHADTINFQPENMLNYLSKLLCAMIKTRTVAITIVNGKMYIATTLILKVHERSIVNDFLHFLAKVAMHDTSHLRATEVLMEKLATNSIDDAITELTNVAQAGNQPESTVSDNECIDNFFDNLEKSRRTMYNVEVYLMKALASDASLLVMLKVLIEFLKNNDHHDWYKLVSGLHNYTLIKYMQTHVHAEMQLLDILLTQAEYNPLQKDSCYFGVSSQPCWQCQHMLRAANVSFEATEHPVHDPEQILPALFGYRSLTCHDEQENAYKLAQQVFTKAQQETISEAKNAYIGVLPTYSDFFYMDLEAKMFFFQNELAKLEAEHINEPATYRRFMQLAQAMKAKNHQMLLHLLKEGGVIIEEGGVTLGKAIAKKWQHFTLPEQLPSRKPLSVFEVDPDEM